MLRRVKRLAELVPVFRPPASLLSYASCTSAPSWVRGQMKHAVASESNNIWTI